MQGGGQFCRSTVAAAAYPGLMRYGFYSGGARCMSIQKGECSSRRRQGDGSKRLAQHDWLWQPRPGAHMCCCLVAYQRRSGALMHMCCCLIAYQWGSGALMHVCC